MKPLLATTILLFSFLSIGHGDDTHTKSAHRFRRVKLSIDYKTQKDTNGNPILEGGEPVVSYIPSHAVLDQNGHYDIRTDIIIHSHPATPHHYFGHLVSLEDDIQIITSDRIVTDAKGEFRATLRTRNTKGDWDVDIHRVDD